MLCSSSTPSSVRPPNTLDVAARKKSEAELHRLMSGSEATEALRAFADTVDSNGAALLPGFNLSFPALLDLTMIAKQVVEEARYRTPRTTGLAFANATLFSQAARYSKFAGAAALGNKEDIAQSIGDIRPEEVLHVQVGSAGCDFFIVEDPVSDGLVVCVGGVAGTATSCLLDVAVDNVPLCGGLVNPMHLPTARAVAASVGPFLDQLGSPRRRRLDLVGHGFGASVAIIATLLLFGEVEENERRLVTALGGGDGEGRHIISRTKLERVVRGLNLDERSSGLSNADIDQVLAEAQGQGEGGSVFNLADLAAWLLGGGAPCPPTKMLASDLIRCIALGPQPTFAPLSALPPGVASSIYSFVYNFDCVPRTCSGTVVKLLLAIKQADELKMPKLKRMCVLAGTAAVAAQDLPDFVEPTEQLREQYESLLVPGTVLLLRPDFDGQTCCDRIGQEMLDRVLLHSSMISDHSLEVYKTRLAEVSARAAKLL